MATFSSALADPIPLDIVITIIDELARMKDYQSLQACSFLCRALLRFCQKHLFGAFDTTDYPGYDAHRLVVSYYQLLTWSPHIIPYVKVFRLIPISVDFMESPFLPVILSKLRYLHTFEMSLIGQLARQEWDMLNSELLLSLYDIASLSSLHTLSLNDVSGVPVSFFEYCGHVKALHLHDVDIDDDADIESENETRSSPLLVLDELKIPDSRLYDIHPGVFHCFDISRLNRLLVQCPLPHDSSWYVIEKTGGCLKHLTFHDRHFYYSDSDEEDSPFESPLSNTSLELSQRIFKSLPVLEIFEFTVVMKIPFSEFDTWEFDVFYSDLHPFHRWFQLLQSAPPSLRKISMSLDFTPSSSADVLYWFDAPTSSSRPFATMANWACLDEIFANKSELPNLEVIEVKIILPETTDDTFSDSSDSLIEDDESTLPYERAPEDRRVLSVDNVVRYTQRRLKLSRQRGILEVLTEIG